jgi:hypothetical protein
MKHIGSVDKLLKRMRLLEIDHEPDGWPAVQMKDISKLCNLVENAVPSIDLLQARFERGQKLAMQDGKWHLFDKEGEGVTSGKTLRDILLNLIWMDF